MIDIPAIYIAIDKLTLGDLNRETRPSKELTKLMADMESKHGKTFRSISNDIIYIFDFIQCILCLIVRTLYHTANIMLKDMLGLSKHTSTPNKNSREKCPLR